MNKECWDTRRIFFLNAYFNQIKPHFKNTCKNKEMHQKSKAYIESREGT